MSICPTCQAEFGAEISFCPHDGSALQTGGREPELVGRVINQRYRILRLLGEGGWGQVYLAEHVRMGRRDAIKILNQSISRSADAVGRFQREALNASRIVHPNVVAIYDFGETSDQMLYIAMEYVEGETLSRLLKANGALPTARALHIARQTADALAAAHELSIVHRDLKPDNILITSSRDGSDRVKVVDFGIAKATGETDQKITRTGFAVGTPGYMSPEQLVGDEVDPRSDLYSLSCILYEMLTGEQAFVGPSTEIVLRRLTQPPPRLRERNARVSSVLDDLVARGMATSPADRFQSATEFCDSINAILQAGPDGVLQLTSWGRTGPATGGSTTPTGVRTPAEELLAAGGASGTLQTDASVGGRSRRRRQIVAASVIGVVLLAGAGAIWRMQSKASTTGMPATSAIGTVPSESSTVSTALVQPLKEPVPEPPTPAGRDETAPPLEQTGSTRAKESPGRTVASGPVRPPEQRTANREPAAAPRPETASPPDLVDRAQTSAPRVPALPASPPPSTLVAIRELIQTGKSMALHGDFEGAYTALSSAESQLNTLQHDYPDSKEVRQLAQQRTSELAEANKACESLRMVRLLRNEAAPQCH